MDYMIDGQADPSITVTRGETYTFNVSSQGHPFWIKSVQGNTQANAYNDGVTGNGTQSGTITFVVPSNAPDTLFYNCEIHSMMTGQINVVD